VATEPFPIPSRHGIRIDDDETARPSRPAGSQSHPEGAVDIVEHRTWALALERQDLLTEGEVLNQEFGARHEQGPDRASAEGDEEDERAGHGLGVCRSVRLSSTPPGVGRQRLADLT
jgi:hypothetical protein